MADDPISYMSDVHHMLQQTCRDFADAQLAPIAHDLDKEHRYPAEQIAQSARATTPFSAPLSQPRALSFVGTGEYTCPSLRGAAAPRPRAS